MKERIILFGGTFDPPHLGHKALVDYAYKQLNPNRIIVLPCYIQPLKNTFMADCWQRLQMAELMFQNVSDFEISKHDISYSIDTIKYYINKYSNSRILFVMGADSFISIKKWRAYQEILQSVNIVIIPRDECKNISELLCKANLQDFYKKSCVINEDIQLAYSRKKKMIILLSNFYFPISSTQIRDLLQNGEKEVSKHLDSKVWDYIIKNKLYKIQE